MKRSLPYFCAVLVLLGSAGCKRDASGPKVAKGIPEQYILEVERRDVDYSIEVAGDVAPEFELVVKSEVGGKVKTLFVEPGQEVKAGDLLCEIDDTDLQNQLASVETEIAGSQLGVHRAQLQFNRGEELFKAKLITKEAFDNLESDLAFAKNDLAKAERRIQSAKDQISKARIVAPINGTVLRVDVIEGEVVVPAASVNSGTELMTLADLSKLRVTAHVNQVDVAFLKLKQNVDVTMESLRQENMQARVSFIAPTATTKNSVKGFKVQASIVNPSPRLRPGMMVNLTIPVATAREAVAVPASAVFRGANDSRVVWLLGEDGQPQEHEVTLGISSLDYTEIKSGLKAGDRILAIEPRMLNKKS